MIDATKQEVFYRSFQQLQDLLYHYRKILDQEKSLGHRWVNANKAFHKCHVGNSLTLIHDQSKIEHAIELVHALDTSCQESATRRDTARAQNRLIPYYHEFQKLTQKDRRFITERKTALSSVMPIDGIIEYFAETGTEGAFWILDVGGTFDRNTMKIINPGDRLVIFNSDGSTLFDEVLILDYVSGWVSFRQEWPYGTGQQSCGGLNVHWIPKGMSSDQWKAIFIDHLGYKAKLYQSPS